MSTTTQEDEQYGSPHDSSEEFQFNCESLEIYPHRRKYNAPVRELSPRRNAKKSCCFCFSLPFSLAIERKGNSHFDLAIVEAHRD
jgi:hypothetical protein